jgi:hypothetical protein
MKTSKTSKTTGSEPLRVVSEMVEAGDVDTVYRDVYLDRARALLGGALPPEEFEQIEQQRTQLGELPLAIGRAVDRGDWPKVKELSARTQALRQAVEGKVKLMGVARRVYAVSDISLDPFSPGLAPFTRTAANLPALRTQAIDRLAALERADAPWQGFYAGRRAAFQALEVAGARPAAAGKTAAAPVADPRMAAAHAVKTGDMRGLQKLAEAMMAAVEPPTGGSAVPERSASGPVASGAAKDLSASYTADTLEGARRLGLAPRRLESRVELASLRAYAWNPVLPDQSGQIKQVPLPAGTPEAFRDRLEMLMIHPLVNSGGARHLPTLVAEDVLVEDFPDPGEDEQPPVSELLTSLGLVSRRGVPRIAIERGLLARGARVLEHDLHLDPQVFRLVCIPPDVHLRLGEAEGWGRQPLWTHFDGYLIMASGALRALAGGSGQFGGLSNLVSLGRDYDSDRLVARFAVVRRERMVAW